MDWLWSGLCFHRFRHSFYRLLFRRETISWARLKKTALIWQIHNWSHRGDAWSYDWGTSDAEWYGTLLPRIHSWLSVHTILELGPGFGRWTQYLKEYADKMILVDVTPRCIEGCRARFGNESHIVYHVNDGRSLPMIDDRSVDFVFSFDSLVHVDEDAIASYLAEIRRTLTKDGVAFLHHSNLGAHALRVAVSKVLPSLVNRALHRYGFTVMNAYWRAENESAELFVKQCSEAGLVCRSQEIIPWGTGGPLSDCISVVTLPSSRWAQPTHRTVNRQFLIEARHCKARSALYES